MLRLFYKIADFAALIGAAGSAAAALRQHRQPGAQDLRTLRISPAELRGVIYQGQDA